MNSIHSFGTNLSQLMFISLPNEQAFEAAWMWLPLHIPAWNKECVYACCAAALQLTSSSDTHLLMVAPVSCLWSLFPEEKQITISSLTLHQPSSTGKTRLPLPLCQLWHLNWFWGWYSCCLLRVLLATYAGFQQEGDLLPQPQHKLFTMVLFLNLLNTYRKFSVKKYQ